MYFRSVFVLLSLCVRARTFIWICMFVQAAISVVSIYCLSLCRSVCFCVRETLLKTSQHSVAASLLWKWIVGILYLSMPPFGPWNARAYFPIMALSCSQLPWEPRSSPRSALLTPLLCRSVKGEMRRKKGRECAIQCYDEWTLMRDSYYAQLIILSLHWGDCQ